MLVKDVLKRAAINLGDEPLQSALESNVVQDESAKLLLKCLNTIVDEIATDYIPLIHEEELITNNGDIEFIGLKKPLIDVLKIKDKYDRNVKYKLYPDRIHTDCDIVKITYSYLPGSLDFDDEIIFPKLTSRVLSYGVSMEYAFLNSLSDEASIFERRFRDGMGILVRKKSEQRISKRRWL